MKRQLFALVLLPILACGIISFDLEQPIKEVTVKGVDLTNPSMDANTLFPPMSMNLDLDKEIAARDTGPAKSAHLKELTLEITNTAKNGASDEDSFDFFKELHIVINGKNGSNLPPKKIAWIKDFSPKSTTLNLTVDDSIDLLPYINEGGKISCEAGGLFPPQDNVSYKGNITITIKV